MPPPPPRGRRPNAATHNPPKQPYPYNEEEDATDFPQNVRFRGKQGLPKGFMGFGRMLTVMLGFLAIFLLMVGQVFNLQVIQGQELREKAARSQHRSPGKQVYRGRIVDRNGVVLAQDTLVYDLYVHPQFFEGQPPAKIARALAKHLKRPASEILKILKRDPNTVLVANNLPRGTMQAIRQSEIKLPVQNEKTGETTYQSQRMNGLDFYQKPLRQYPQGHLAAHVLGYVNDAAELSTGVHSKLDALSKSWFLQRRTAPLLVDGKGRPLEYEPDTLKSFVQVADAQDVQLTLDSRLQFIAERELKAGMETSKADRAALVMLQPKTGEVLAMAAYPDFHPEKYQKASYEELKNWAITDVYEPGSTIKILTLATALEQGKIKPEDTILDTGKMQVGGWWLRNYDYAKFPYPGEIDLVYLLQHSSNVGSAKLALMLDKEAYFQQLKALGFGAQTGLSMMGESRGKVPPPEEWSESRHASLGYGYGLMTTPLQMAMAINSIANDGVWVPPKLIKGVRADGLEESQRLARDLREALKQPRPHRVYSPETTEVMSELLVKAIEASKTNPANLEGMEVAGKTGTAKKVNPKGKGYTAGSVVTSFVGYFPAKDPKILMMVVVDNPKMAESWGSTVAAPIFRKVALETIHYLGLTPVSNTKS